MAGIRGRLAAAERALEGARGPRRVKVVGDIGWTREELDAAVSEAEQADPDALVIGLFYDPDWRPRPWGDDDGLESEG